MTEVIKLPKIADPRGNLSFVQSGDNGVLPFPIAAVRWWYDLSCLPGSSVEPSADSEAMFIDLSGSFDCDGETFRSPDRGMYVSGGHSFRLTDFAANTVVMMLAGDGKPGVPEPAGTTDTHPASLIDDCRMIDLPRVSRPGAGSCSWIDNNDSPLPFSVRRVFYLYDVPADAERGGHSHFQAQELIVAMAGSFDVILDDGKNPPRRFTLNRPYRGLYIPAGIWRTLENFSGGAVSTVLTSHAFSEPDYVREYDRFKSLTNPR